MKCKDYMKCVVSNGILNIFCMRIWPDQWKQNPYLILLSYHISRIKQVQYLFGKFAHALQFAKGKTLQKIATIVKYLTTLSTISTSQDQGVQPLLHNYTNCTCTTAVNIFDNIQDTFFVIKRTLCQSPKSTDSCIVFVFRC